ncbi:hypothetical protein IAQ61_005865 [Plenodomus lingam]|uniref:Predicted protein n=1 Tax=Leptosphaeria maculans (strain JN3 / isolate v23.1.3 / race Av1-4-5-6-7-8) TaxID=985895 RepID=E4ZLT9_LEPMJ|nr:predicted protein [Plenodomus lingam JN3]KAH9870390.1 hypothetical protein IAQ61_005865 [Plenodomus lingam]CBX92769.1 predicted protein [Plenodomus lingam JN3]
MSATSEHITFREFRPHTYPYDTLDRDQLASYRIVHHLPVDGTSVPRRDSSSIDGDPSPPRISQEDLPRFPTPPPTKPPCKLVQFFEDLSKRLLKTLRSCKLFHSCFPLSELSDPDSATARMLHAHWEDRPEPPPHWTYQAAERRPGIVYLPSSRSRFVDDTTGRPTWVLEAEATEQGRL